MCPCWEASAPCSLLGTGSPTPLDRGSPQSAFNVFFPPMASWEPQDLLVGSLSVFALKGRQGCQVPWGLRKEEAILLDWGVEKPEGPTLRAFESKERPASGCRSTPASSAPLEASAIPASSPGAKTGMQLLVQAGRGLVLLFTGALPGRNLFP